ncbi:MAG: BamA/TamA family outer membrane protein, partial [Bacteroidota bacterium]
LNDKLVLIAINSAWVLSDWDDYLQVNKDCDLRTRSQFYLELQDEIKKYYRTHNVIVAMHHPIKSVGYRGGYYSAKDHLFPINNGERYLPVPLPVVGSVTSLFRSKIGSRRDLVHPRYREFSDRLDGFKRDYPGLIVVGAHDHSLQYLRDKDQHYIVSGSATQATAVRDKAEAQFGFGGVGYGTLDIYKDGAVRLKFYGQKNKKETLQLLFDEAIKPAFTPLEEILPDSFPVYESDATTVQRSVLKPGEIKTYNPKWWGDLHSDFYFTKVQVPIIRLDTIHGGLTPIRRGGGFQTNSLHLIDTAGHLYKMRSLRKESDRLLPWPFNKTFASDIAAYFLTAGNPFGALALDRMAASIGIYHTTPQLYYLPKQPALGLFYNIPEGLYLLEERPDEDWRTLDHFGYSKDIISNSKMVEELLESDKAVVDQEWTLRTRLFDILIGDWDRHVDQWRWASKPIPNSDRTLYRPIPRDRDQVFSKYDGIIPSTLRGTFPFLRSTQSFDYQIKEKDVKWMNRQARNFDRIFLNELSWSDWEAAVHHLQKELTDEVIRQSIQDLPEEIYKTGIGEEWISKLKRRRDDLMQYARQYFKVLYEEVNIQATHKENLIRINRVNDQLTTVKIWEYRNDQENKDLIFDGSYNNSITKIINIYGLDDDDDFLVEGTVDNSPLLRLIGGNDEDTFIDQSKVRGFRQMTKIYDNYEATEIEKSKETDLKLSDRKAINSFAYHGHHLDYGFPVPFFGFNPDDGVFIGGNYMHNGFGFKRHNKQNLSALYAFSTNAWSLQYRGNFYNILDQNDLYFEAALDGPQFVVNFFGRGNETTLPDNDRDFSRVRRARGFVLPAFQRRFNDGNTRLRAGPIYEWNRVEQTADRVLTSEDMNINPTLFDGKHFVGAQLGFEHENIDNPFFPQNGIVFQSSIAYRNQLQDSEADFTSFMADLKLYHCFDRANRFSLATRVGIQHVNGTFDFHQGAMLGGNNNLRGYRRERFNGNTAFYHNTDLRMRLFSLKNSPIPSSLGITAGFDYGRVWVPEEQSDKWHYGYGGQVWLAPMNYFVISTGVFFSEEDTRFSLRFGFSF